MIAIDAAGDGEPLVLLHGVGANRIIWQHAAPRLARTRLVLAPDLPGFGESPPVADGFDLNRTADAVADATVATGAQPFDLVGNSLGGAVAAVLACRRPELVRRLVLVAPAGFNPHPRLLSEVVGRLGGSVTSLRRVLGMPFVGNDTARRVLLWTPRTFPKSSVPRSSSTCSNGSSGGWIDPGASRNRFDTTSAVASLYSAFAGESSGMATPMLATTSAVRTREGRSITFWAAGPHDGFPVVYCHGAIGSPRWRTPQVDELIQRLQIRYVVVNRPGFGGSEPYPGRTVADFACDVEHAIDALGYERFSVVGVSAGAPVRARLRLAPA